MIALGGKFALGNGKQNATSPMIVYLTNGIDYLKDEQGRRLYIWRESPRYDTNKTNIL